MYKLKQWFSWAVFLFFSSCIDNSQKETNCRYSLEFLYNNFDTSNFEKPVFREKGLIDIVEKSNKLGQRGVYTFDANNTLRSYSFIRSKNNEYFFSIEYDSLGNEINRTGSEVVEWVLRKKNDTLTATFNLFSLNYSYKNVTIKYGNSKFENLQLYKSPFLSNIIGRTIDAKFLENKADRTIFIFGQKTNLCKNETKEFIDSIEIFDDFY